MKKDRNTFFENSSMNMAFNAPSPQMMQPIMPMTEAQAQASQSFYANTGAPMMYMTPSTMNYQDTSISELESKIAKLERNMNRLENRLNKLEGATYYSENSTYDSSSSNMYMV